MHPRVVEAYHEEATRSLVTIDVLYESYLDKKREAKMQAESGGKRILAHFSINESDMTLYELFDDGDLDDELNSENPLSEDE